MAPRRVVTGHDRAGRAVIVEDGPVPRFYAYRGIPGASSALPWSTGTDPIIPNDGVDPTGDVTSYVPEPGGTRFLILELPPDSVYASPAFAPDVAAGEYELAAPGFAEFIDKADPTFHQTPTVDYGIVLNGEIWLELYDGESAKLSPGDVIVQNGTRHAWRNKGSVTATVAFVMIGARPESAAGEVTSGEGS